MAKSTRTPGGAIWVHGGDHARSQLLANPTTLITAQAPTRPPPVTMQVAGNQMTLGLRPPLTPALSKCRAVAPTVFWPPTKLSWSTSPIAPRCYPPFADQPFPQTGLAMALAATDADPGDTVAYTVKTLAYSKAYALLQQVGNLSDPAAISISIVTMPAKMVSGRAAPITLCCPMAKCTPDGSGIGVAF